MPDDREVNRTLLIKQWIQEARGRWSNKQLDHELGVDSPEARNLRRWVVKQMCDAGVCERIPKLEGVYRTVEGPPQQQDWQNIDTPEVALKFPFGLEKYVTLYRKGIVVIAGEKETGKTPLCYGVVLLNMFHPLGVDLFYTGEGPLKERMYSSDIEIPNPAPFRVFERMDNFADVIDPDRISVIDYMDLGSELYLVGDEINKIFQKLDKGIAVIALQKPPPAVTIVKGVKKRIHRELAYGGAFSAKRAILYISLDGSKEGGKLRIVYAKKPAIPTVNPKNKMWSYRFDQHGWFTDIAEFEEPEQEVEL